MSGCVRHVRHVRPVRPAMSVHVRVGVRLARRTVHAVGPSRGVLVGAITFGLWPDALHLGGEISLAAKIPFAHTMRVFLDFGDDAVIAPSSFDQAGNNGMSPFRPM